MNRVLDDGRHRRYEGVFHSQEGNDSPAFALEL